MINPVRGAFAFLASVIIVAGCGGSEKPGANAATGGSMPFGGSAGSGGSSPTESSPASGSAGAATTGGGSTGGALQTGGISSSLGGSPQTGGKSTGGSNAGGGFKATGGSSERGGSSATGGRTGFGGTPLSGGETSAGGTVQTGGRNSAGGNSATGGGVAVGGTSTTGARTATGGNVATGGSNVSGGSSTGGKSATGGSSAVIGATPPMGWNSWNTFACNGLNETVIKGVADTFVSSGMKDVGYQYVNLDDCWMNGRDSSGKIQVNTSKFPAGMPALVKYVHDKGLKLGLYSTPGTKTCANIYSGYTGGVGSLGYETTDAQTYASWGIDYLKYDKCTSALSGFAVMRDALRATGRDIFYSINPGDGTGCVPGKCSINLLDIANMWRIGFDINASWSSITGLIDQNAPLYSYAGPGHWNDPDMLEVGNGSLTTTENQAHFSMWAIMAAPLIAGNDITKMNATTKGILTNAEVIAVDQDALGVQGKVVATPGAELQVWAKKLSGTNTVAVALFNRGSSNASITAQWNAIGIPAGKAKVRDLWSHTDLGTFDGSYTAASVPSHGVVLLTVVSS